MNTNKTNMKELNINEMEQINGGSIRYKHTQDYTPLGKWFSNDFKPAAKNFGTIVRVLGKSAYNWFTGLFD